MLMYTSRKELESPENENALGRNSEHKVRQLLAVPALLSISSLIQFVRASVLPAARSPIRPGRENRRPPREGREPVLGQPTDSKLPRTKMPVAEIVLILNTKPRFKNSKKNAISKVEYSWSLE